MSLAVVPARAKLAVPAASTVIVIGPVAGPLKLTTPPLSLTLKPGVVTASTASSSWSSCSGLGS